MDTQRVSLKKLYLLQHGFQPIFDGEQLMGLGDTQVISGNGGISPSYDRITKIGRGISLVWRALGRVILECPSDLLFSVPAYSSNEAQLWEDMECCCLCGI